MKELDMIKAFAELEGDNIRANEVRGYAWLHSTGETYDPFLPNSLNCAARDKYGVHVDYLYMTCSIWKRSKYSDDRISDVDFINHDLLPKAVIECILKSQGLWK